MIPLSIASKGQDSQQVVEYQKDPRPEQINTGFYADPEFEPMRNYFEFSNIRDYETDFGNIISCKPTAVFKPPRVDLLQSFLKLASQYQVKVTCRGKGNSAYGQAQCLDGVVVDLKELNIEFDYNPVDGKSISVPAFKTWYEEVHHIREHKKTVPVTVDNLDLTVGGTLSFGAIGGTSYRCGSGADHVLSLDVLTVNGERLTCSNTENPELFNAVLCGLGQFAIILNVTVPVVDAKELANRYEFTYDSVSQFLSDQIKLYRLNQFDHLKGYVRKKEEKWEYVIEAACYFDDQEPEEISDITKQLSSSNPTSLETLNYWDFINLVTGFMGTLRQAGKLHVPHPWYNVFLPEHEIEKHLVKALESPHLTGKEPIIVYPMNSELFHRPLFMKPDCQTFYLVGILFNTSIDATMDFPYEEVLQANSELYQDARDRGGCRYPVDAHAFTVKDWQLQYGSKWEKFCSLKDTFDPHHLLSTGCGIFP